MLKRAMPPVSTGSSLNAAALKEDDKGNIPSEDHALDTDGREQTGVCTELNTAKHRTERHLRVPVEILRVRVLHRGAHQYSTEEHARARQCQRLADNLAEKGKTPCERAPRGSSAPASRALS